MLLDTEQLNRNIAEIQEKLDSGDIPAAVRIAARLSNRRLVDIISEAPKETALPFLEALGPVRSARVLSYLLEELAVELLQELNSEFVQEVFIEMEDDEIADIILHLPEDERDKYWALIPNEYKDDVEEIVTYEEESVGAYMEKDFLTGFKDDLVKDAIDMLSKARGEIDNTDYIYVINEDDKLLGVVSVQELAFAARNERLENIMTVKVHVARVNEPAIEAARLMKYRKFKLLPVLDLQDRLVGVMALHEAIDLLSEELAEDFVSISGASAEESYFTPPKDAIKMRLPWMAANVFLNLGAVAVISTFEDTIAQVAILAAFIPMITDMGGNVGIQALSVSIRSIALGEVQIDDVKRVLRKELSIGLINGLALGSLFAIIAYILQREPMIGLIAGIALGFNVIVAGVVGGTIPFLINKIGKDPAMMTGPVLTTITDITGVTIYLGLSTIFLWQLLA